MNAVLEYWPFLLKGFFVTVWIAAGSIIGAAIGGLILGMLRLSERRWVSILAICLIEVVRGASALVLLFWVFYALPLLPGMPHLSPMFASILVLALIGASYAAEIVRGGIEAVTKGQAEASHALGLSPLQGLQKVVLPQALSQIIPAFSSLAADMVKWTSIVSFVGVQDLLYAANLVRSETYKTTAVFVLLCAVYWALCLLLTLLFRGIEHLLPLNRAMRGHHDPLRFALGNRRVAEVPR